MEASRPVQVMLPPSRPVQPHVKQESPITAEGSQDDKVKMLSVHHALQYTPLTTCVLPAHDRIAIPQITRARESIKLTASAEKKAMQQLLSQYPTTKVKDRLQSLLKADILPEYKFKKWPIKQGETTAKSQKAVQPDIILSPTAKAVLEMTAIDYTCASQFEQRPVARDPSKTETLHQIANKQNQPIFKSEFTQQLSKSASLKSSQKVQLINDRTLVGPDGQMAAVSKPASGSISINIPKPKPIASSTTVQTTQQIDNGKPRMSHSEPVVQLSLHVQSQKEAADAALQQFQNTLLEVFEAQDQLDAGSNTVFEHGFFEHIDEGDESEPNLTVKTMERLLTGLKKLTSMNKLSDLSAEHLRRLQILCEPAIDRVQTINLKVQSDADIDEQQRWRQNIRKADSGLLSANLCLHTIMSASPDEALLTTEALTWIPTALRNIFENCLIPAVEARPDDSTSDFFKIVTNFKEDVRRLLESSRKVLDLTSIACTKTRGLETVVNPIEFLAAKLIFIQNSATDKSSVLGIQTFEKARKTAMASLARIFARYPAERSAILDEILASLDKLPSNSRSARQYRLGDGHSIQLISALFMQLVQNTALESPETQSKSKRSTTSKKFDDLDDTENDKDDENEMQVVQEHVDANQDDALTKLQKKGNKLFDVAARSAQEIVLYLVGRASKTTKSGDSPYRNVLDLFIEDMVTVLSIPEWPSSELMLRIMAAKMTDMAQNEKTASAKNMALECLGTMGSAISTLKSSLSRQCSAVFKDGKSRTAVAEHLSRLASDQDQGGISNEGLISFNGPFAIVSRHLWTEADHGLRNLSACGFFLAQYAKVMSLFVNEKTFDESDIESEPVRVANFLIESIAQIGSGSTTMHNFDVVSSEEAELAYTLSVLNMGFCRRFGLIVKTLSSSFSSDQAQVRSRSLKSVVAMLETDSTLLDRDQSIADDVFKCASDDSAMVRDSALSLIARFIIARPALEQKGIQRLLECASDAKVGVQKRAVGHLRDIYVKDTRPNLRSTISRVILKRTADHEDTVADLAKKTMIEIWITPALTQLIQSADMARTRVTIADLTSDIVGCISHDTNLLCPLLKKFIKAILTGDNKGIGKAKDLCAKIIDVLFERIISNQDDRGPLMVLTSFAEADPQLIPPSSLGKLQPYLGNLKTENDLFVFKAVISIFSFVLPHLSATHKPLLLETQNALMKAISSLGRRAELDTVMSCLQVIDGVLQNTMRLIKLAGSIMLKIKSAAASLNRTQEGVPQLLKLLRIAGSMGRNVDLEKYWQQFGQEVKDMQGRSVAGYMANTLLPLTHPTQDQTVRRLALDSLGSVCQAFPGQFNQKAIRETFFSVFASEPTTVNPNETETLQTTVLRVFDELYAQRAKSKEGDENADDDQDKQELGKLGGDSRTRDGDSAISMITGTVAKSALAVALTTPSENALIATRIVASISHQGLSHPKHSLLAFVALSTCSDTQIAAVAHAAHRVLHQQHESVCEREYTNAVQEAFAYQYKVLEDPRGARLPSYKAKLELCFEVVNTSGTKYVKKFLSGVITRITTKLSTEDGALPIDQVLWTLFAIQNLVFFEFGKVDEVLHAILQLELAYSKKGVEISQLLEAALSTDPAPEVLTDSAANGEDQTMHDAITNPQLAIRGQTVQDINTVTRLAPLAATLTILMEGRSYLKRQYGIGRDVRTAISNNKQAKETSKAPTRVYGITGEKFWTKSNATIDMLLDDSGRILCCQNFVSLMSMDDEVTVEEDEGFREPSGNIAPVETHDYARGTTPGGIKRKLSASATSTPAKRGPGRPKKDARRSTSVSSVDNLDAGYSED